MQTVELKSAYCWHCEDCGFTNFDLPQKAELTDEDREAAYRKFHDLSEFSRLPEGWQDFELVMIPDTVTCPNCHREFKAIDERSDTQPD